LTSPHFEREENGRHIVLNCRSASKVKGKGGLTQSRASCNQNQLTGMQAIGQFIELCESGWYPGHTAIASTSSFYFIYRGTDGLIEGNNVFIAFTSGDSIDFGLGIVDQIQSLTLTAIAHLHNPCARLDQAA